jgi:hypothetical protein
MVPFEDFPGWHGLRRAPNWSIQAALAGAYCYGATAIDVYGHDMEGADDVAGHLGTDRSDERWFRERADWNCSVEWLISRNVAVRHIKG